MNNAKMPAIGRENGERGHRAASLTRARTPERFQILGELGRGGMGVVLEAFDAARGISVALKMIPDVSAVGVTKLKQEFRVLADLQHPNLVRLLDLVVDGERAFFTMERIDGVDFQAFCRPTHDAGAFAADSTVVQRSLRTSQLTDQDAAPVSTSLSGEVDEPRLRRALEQLVRGLAALHAEGLVHRDVKPSNCLVSRGGRVVVLDFGLVQPILETTEGRAGKVVGTVNYMAPEQARGEATLSPAADWYAVGVMLYEALSGVLPFSGPTMRVMFAKLTETPPPLAQLAPTAPRDLVDLAMALLSREPTQRPDAASILTRLTGSRASLVPPRQATPLLQREEELAALQHLFAHVAAGRGAIATVRGVSGAGKSALLSRALERARASTQALVLSGRCYPREVVPFNAFDRVIDQLAASLAQRRGDPLVDLTPEERHALTRVFPALSATSSAEPSHDAPWSADARGRARDRAFHALRRLLGALAAHSPVIVVLDDVQWADADSLALTGALVNGAALPGVAIVASFRQADEAAPRCAALLRRAIADGSLRWESLDLSVGPLDATRAIQLAELLVQRDDPGSAQIAHSIARVTEGLPIGIVELAKLVRDAHEAGRPIEAIESVDATIRARFEALPDDCRRLLELIVVSEGPLPVRVARRALGHKRDEDDPVAMLAGEHWVREETRGANVAVDTQHDRLREVIGAALPAKVRRAHHELIARALELEAPGMHEHLAHHLAEAGHFTEAIAHSTRAADEAMRLLAFDRAARLLGRAASLAGDTSRTELALPLAQALVLAGRGAEAAAVALPAADGRHDHEARDLRRLAAEGLLQTGRLEPALNIYRTIARDEAITLPRGRLWTLFALGFARLALARRGLEPRFGSDAGARRRVDMLNGLSSVLILLDPLAGALIHTRRLLVALEHGDEQQVTVALAMEGLMRAAIGDRATGKAVVSAALARAEALNDGRARSVALLARGIVAYTEWRLTDTERDLHAAEAALLDTTSGTPWELLTGRLFRYFAAIAGGRYRSALHDLAEHREDARRRNDLYATAVLGTMCASFQQLAANRPDLAHRALDESLDGWPPTPYLLPHLLHDATRAVVLLYERRIDEAYPLALETQARARRAGLLRHQINRARIDQLVAVAAARKGDVRRAKKHARALLRHPAGGMAPVGRMVLGGLAAQAGDWMIAARELRLAVDELAPTEFAAWRAAACWALARLSPVEDSAALEASAEQWVTAEGIVAPHLIYGTFVPWSELDRIPEEVAP